MNSKILAPKIYGAFKIKNLTGGEIDWEKIIPTKAENYPTEDLHELPISELRKEIERCEKELRKLPKMYSIVNGVLKRNLSEGKTLELRDRIRNGYIILNRKKYHRIKTVKASEHGVQKVTPIESPMNRGIFMNYLYEDKKGEIMSLKNQIIDGSHFVEMTIDGKRIIKEIEDKTVLNYLNSPYYNNGGLKVKDLLVLYFSRRLGMIQVKKEGNVFKPLIDMKELLREEKLVPALIGMTKYDFLRVRIRKESVKLSSLERRAYSLRDRSKEEISFLLNLKGEALRVTDCSYYDEEREDIPIYDSNWVDLRALSYNMLDYEKNHVVVLAGEKIHNHIENRLRKLHEEFEYFTTKEGEVVHNLHGLTSNEESAIKSIRREKFGFDESEIEELFDILQEIDGRQSQLHIEHDIRNHYQGKYILQKTSQELFFLKIMLEDAVYGTEQLTDEIEESEIDEEVFLELSLNDYFKKAEEIIEKKLEKLSDKKVKALINVVSGLHLRYEDEEDMGKYLSDELDEIDKVNHDRETKHYKTHRNYYSQTEGVLAPNGNPQTTHRRKSNPPSMSRIRDLRKNHKNVIRGKYAGITHEYDSGEERFIVTFLRNVDEEYERVFGGKTPTPSFSIEYPEYAINNLGFDLDDKDSLHESLSQVSGYMSEKEEAWYREAVRQHIGEKHSAPQFRVTTSIPSKPEETILEEFCNDCPYEGECFVEKCKRISERISLTKYLGINDLSVTELKELYEVMEPDIPADQRLPGRKSIKVQLIEERVNNSSNSSSLKEDKIIEFGDGLYQVRKDGFEFLAKGNIKALDLPSVSFSGIREPKKETVEFVKKTVKNLSNDYVIVSGLAKGCDTISHRTCLDNNGITIAVLPCGFDNIFPEKNEDLAQEILDNNGLLLSEYYPKTKANKERLVKRNRLIAGLSNTVIICEAGKGTKHTAKFAEQQNKNILIQNINTFNNNSMVELGIGKWYNRDEVI